MIYKRGKHGIYWYEFMWKGVRVRKSTGQRNPRVSRQIESAHKTSLAKGEVGIRDRKQVPTFQEFSDQFLKWVAVERAQKPRTVSFYKVRVRFLLAFDSLRSTTMDKIDEALVAKFVEGLASSGFKQGGASRETPAGPPPSDGVATFRKE